MPRELILKYATETEKMYKFTDIDGLINELCDDIEDKNISLSEQLSVQAEYLGYIEYINPKAKNYGYVLDVNTKYSPRLKIYRLDTGETIDIKMSKKDYSKNPISKGGIIKFTTQRKNKCRLVDGKWQKMLNEFEDWINAYSIKNI